MSQLIHMRQRIKTVETIKRITNAMRLISRSSHFRFNKQRQPYQHYYSYISRLFFQLVCQYPEWQPIHTISNQTPTPPTNTLIILVGSQKGLCGNFNSILFTFFAMYLRKHISTDFHLITIGKKAHDYAQTYYAPYEIKAYTDYNAHTLTTISHAVSSTILSGSYTHVVLVSNRIKNFFIYYPHSTTLLPLATESESTKHSPAQESFFIESDPYKTLDQICTLYIQSTIHSALLEAFLAEQSARFISMDNATRNADTILENTRLDYNKLRQAKITKEMIEISSSY